MLHKFGFSGNDAICFYRRFIGFLYGKSTLGYALFCRFHGFGYLQGTVCLLIKIQCVLSIHDGFTVPLFLIPVVHDDQSTDALIGRGSGVDAPDSDSGEDTDRIAGRKAQAPVTEDTHQKREYIGAGCF